MTSRDFPDAGNEEDERDIAATTAGPPAAQTPSECPYCGAPLNANYYFCLACSRPYKPVRTVVTPAMPMSLTDGMLIRRKAPQVTGFFWTYFAVIAGLGVFASVLFDEESFALGLLVREAGLVIATCVYAALYWRALPPQLNHTGFRDGRAWIGVLLLFPLLGINLAYHAWIHQTLEMPNPFDTMREAGVSDSMIFVSLCVLPAVVEEIAFRGLLQHWLMAALKPWNALVLSAAAFTALHFAPASIPTLFALGLLMGWTTWKTRSLWPAMLIHFLHNFLVLELSPMLW